MKIIIDIPKEDYEKIKKCKINYLTRIEKFIKNGTPLPEVHGRLGDLDELEQRINNFVEHDANITDEYTLARQRLIVDGISETRTIIEAESEEVE